LKVSIVLLIVSQVQISSALRREALVAYTLLKASETVLNWRRSRPLTLPVVPTCKRPIWDVVDADGGTTVAVTQETISGGGSMRVSVKGPSSMRTLRRPETLIYLRRHPEILCGKTTREVVAAAVAVAQRRGVRRRRRRN